MDPNQQMGMRPGTYKIKLAGKFMKAANYVKQCKCEIRLRQKWECKRKIELNEIRKMNRKEG